MDTDTRSPRPIRPPESDLNVCNTSLQRNRRGGVDEGKSYVKKNIHDFAGLLRCAKCGSNMSATLDRRRADGWRPSLYGCSRHRVSPKQCRTSTLQTLPLARLYSTTSPTSYEPKGMWDRTQRCAALEQKLLRGDVFSEVDHIERSGLEDMLRILLSGQSGMEYRPPIVFNKNASLSEREILETGAGKRKWP